MFISPDFGCLNHLGVLYYLGYSLMDIEGT